MTTVADALLEAQPGFACGEQDDDGVFQFRMNNVTRGGHLDLSRRRRVPADAHKSISRFLVRAGDVLFNATNSPDGVGKSVLVPDLDEPAVFSNHFLRLRPDPSRVLGGYLSRWLHWNFQRGVFESMCRQWVNQATVTREGLLGMPLPLPPLDEQRRITGIMDQADALRAKRRQVLAHLGDLPKSIFFDMFGRSLPAQERVALKSLTSVITKGTTPTSVGLAFANEGIPFLRVQNLAEGTVRFGTGDLYIDEAAHRNLGRSRVYVGDLLVSIAGTVGRCAIVPEGSVEMNCNQAVAIVRLIDQRIGPWLMTWLSTADAQRQITASSVTATISNLSLGQLGSLQVPSVSEADVVEFNRRLKAVAHFSSATVPSANDLDHLMRSLQSHAFSGRLKERPLG